MKLFIDIEKESKKFLLKSLKQTNHLSEMPIYMYVCWSRLCVTFFHFLNKTISFNVMQVWTHVFYLECPKIIFSWQMTSASWQTYKRTQPRYCLHKLYHAERNKVGMNEELFYISMFFARNLSNSCIWLLIS